MNDMNIADLEQRRRVEEMFGVSRETLDRLAVYVELVRKWQKSQNLVAPSTLPHLWTRHVADSLQVQALVPGATRWLDLGSGAGFPGLVTAICMVGRPGAVVHLVESNKGKAAFLRTVARETGAPAVVHGDRIETVMTEIVEPIEVVTARALASLTVLAGFAAPVVARGAVAVFHKGQDFEAELAEATLSWDLDLVKHPSRIDAGGCLVEVRRILAK